MSDLRLDFFTPAIFNLRNAHYSSERLEFSSSITPSVVGSPGITLPTHSQDSGLYARDRSLKMREEKVLGKFLQRHSLFFSV